MVDMGHLAHPIANTHAGMQKQMHVEIWKKDEETENTWDIASPFISGVDVQDWVYDMVQSGHWYQV